jgi:RNA 3'-terminal phosphate cyclase
MTPMLEKAFAKAAALPDSVQDQLAEQLSEDMSGDAAWDRTLADSQEFLEALATKARAAYQQGKTVKKGFDEL